MSEPLCEAFRHSAWATNALIAACAELSVEQLAHPTRGFGSVIATLNHVVLSDADYAAMLIGVLPDWATARVETDDLDALRARADEIALLWERLLAAPLDADRLLTLDNGTYECSASVVVAQALHHASAHREQVRSVLAELGVRPPDLQPWAYADATGRSRWLNT